MHTALGWIRQSIAIGLFAAFAVLSASLPAEAHHRHTFFYHWDNFPNQAVSVYRCAPMSATSVQTAVANWNANGGLGTIFSYAGDACSSTSGIVVKQNSSLGVNGGRALLGPVFQQRFKEILKDGTQQGRVFFQRYDGTPTPGYAGQFRLSSGIAEIGSTTNVNVIAHEIGHFVGLHEHYYDVTGLSCVTYSVATIMDCADAQQGPTSHDASDASTRYIGNPWGTGAIWITDDSGPLDTSITLNWADINDNETDYHVYKNGMFSVAVGRDKEVLTPIAVSGGECFSVRAMRNGSGNFSSSICRSGPGLPAAPSGVSASVSGNNYTAQLSWTTNGSSYTHEFITVYKGSDTVAQYYVPHHGTGSWSQTVTLGRYDGLAGTYLMEVATCNANHNPWFGGCAGASGSYIFLQP